MAHELAEEQGKVAFAFNANNGMPWHGLGTPMRGLQTLDEMLEKVGADFEVRKVPVAIFDPEKGEYVEVPERFVTSRVRPDGTLQPFEVVKDRYHVVPNREIGEKALAIVGAGAGDLVVETMGCLRDFRKFFTLIDMGTLVIDPAGVADEIKRYLLVSTSHDGSQAITFAQTDVRVVCANTERMAIDGARSVFTARHTPNLDSRMREAQKVLEISTKWAEAFKAEAEALLSVPMTVERLEHEVIDRMWKPEDADTDRKKANRAEIVGAIRALYAGPNNVQRVGENGWAAYNAFTEYLDHYSGGDDLDRREKVLDHDSLLTRRKVKAKNLIKALV